METASRVTGTYIYVLMPMPIPFQAVSKLFGILAMAMEEVPRFADTFAPEACALGFVGTCIRFLEESSADLRDPVCACS